MALSINNSDPKNVDREGCKKSISKDGTFIGSFVKTPGGQWEFAAAAMTPVPNLTLEEVRFLASEMWKLP